MKLSFRSLVCLCLAVCGILCSGILLGGRISAEAKDQQVSVAFSQEDLALLAQESGLAVETWREALQQAGISHWIGQEPASFLLPGEAVGAATQVPLALVENHDRTSVLLPEGVDLETYDGPMVKTLYLYEDYANRATEGDAQEIENLLFRGVVDRGMRLLLLTPFRTETGEYILDPGVYVTCLEDLAARLEARGLTLGETFSCLETEPASPLLLLGAGLVPALLGVWLVCRWSKLQGRGWILVDCAVCPAGAVQALPALAGLGWDSGHGAGPGVELAGRAPCGGPDGVPAVFDGGTDLFRREGGAAAAHCLCCAGAALRSAAGDCGGLAEKLAAHSVGGAPVRRDLRRLPAAVGGLVGALFRPGDHPAQRVGDGLLCPPPLQGALPGGALRAAGGPAGGRCCSSSSSVALGCVWSAFPWSTPSATGWRRWGCP